MTHALSTIQKVHKLSIPLRKPRSPTCGHAQVKLLQYTPDLSTISINLGSLSIKRSYTAGYLTRLHMSMQHFIKLQTASQDLHKLHIRNLKSQCSSYYKSELRLGSFNTQNLLLQTSLTRSLGTCQLILISPTGVMRIQKRIPARSPTPNIQH